MTLTPIRSRFRLRRSGCDQRLGGRVWLPAVAFLIVALFVPFCIIGIGEPERARRPEEFALDSPGAQPEAPAETDTASAPLGLFFPAALPSESVFVPELVWTRHTSEDVDSLSGDAHRSSPAPPPETLIAFRPFVPDRVARRSHVEGTKGRVPDTQRGHRRSFDREQGGWQEGPDLLLRGVRAYPPSAIPARELTTVRPAAVLSDLDGTLLDHGGVLGVEAREAIGELRRRGIPVVPLTSKTEVELRDLLVELDSGGIGSFENGAGVVGPGGIVVSEKAIPAGGLSARLGDLARLTGLRLTPAAALPTSEICRITGFPEARVPAMLARGYGLPFVAPEGAAEALWRFATRLPATRLTRGGQFWHLSGDHGKEDAVELLCRNGLVSRPLVGFGDAPNDAGFLDLCDLAVLVPRASGEVDPDLLASIPAGRLAPFPAGRGWAAAISDLLGEAIR